MENRSVPIDTVLPHVVYRDVAAAIVWLHEAFGFAEHYRYGAADGQVQGAQVVMGQAWIMLERACGTGASPASLERDLYTQYLTVFVNDVDAHFDTARSAGVTIFEDVNETVYGERQYGAIDLEGHRWLFSQHVRDLLPEEWGAETASPER